MTGSSLTPLAATVAAAVGLCRKLGPSTLYEDEHKLKQVQTEQDLLNYRVTLEEIERAIGLPPSLAFMEVQALPLIKGIVENLHRAAKLAVHLGTLDFGLVPYLRPEARRRINAARRKTALSRLAKPLMDALDALDELQERHDALASRATELGLGPGKRWRVPPPEFWSTLSDLEREAPKDGPDTNAPTSARQESDASTKAADLDALQSAAIARHRPWWKKAKLETSEHWGNRACMLYDLLNDKISPQRQRARKGIPESVVFNQRALTLTADYLNHFEGFTSRPVRASDIKSRLVKRGRNAKPNR